MNAVNVRTPTAPAIPSHPAGPDNRWLTGWDRRSFLELRVSDTAPGSARGHVVSVLREWGLGRLADSTAVVASELVTNSVLAVGAVRWRAERPPLRMWLRGNSVSVLLLVGDAADGAPVRREAGTGDEGGRGLAIVAALSARWGCYRPPAPSAGKVTWALVDTP